MNVILSKIFNFIHKPVIKKVNKMLGWKLPKEAMGAYFVWLDKGKLIILVETSDGGTSAIEYQKFLDKAKDGKVSQNDFCECFY